MRGSTRAVPEDRANVHLIVSNQSFDDPVVAMAVAVDGEVVVDQDPRPTRPAVGARVLQGRAGRAREGRSPLGAHGIRLTDIGRRATVVS